MQSIFRRYRNGPNGDASARAEPVPGPDFDRQVATLIPAEVRMISACHSLETAADISNLQLVTTPQGQLPSPAGRSGGACTSALLSILYDPNFEGISFQKLLLELRSRLAQSGMSQIPQLSGSRPLDLAETPFSLVNQQPEYRNRHRGGTCRALLVGINYIGQNGQLSGCINDVMNVKKYICEHQGYLEDYVLVLTDDGRHDHFPTREKIIKALRQLVAQSVPGDSVYFHYSGHGGLLDPDYWNRFKAGKKLTAATKEYDETLYPVDHGLAGQIRDFSLFNHFVKPMPAGVTVTCVMDCCHSGSVLDLPYSYQPTAAGTIRMRQSMDTLTNLAFLYILAGGMLPNEGGLFESVAQNLQDVTGESIDALTGTGVEEMTFDTETFGGGEYGDEGGVPFDETGFDTNDAEDFGERNFDTTEGVDANDSEFGLRDPFLAFENADDVDYSNNFPTFGGDYLDTTTERDGGDLDCGDGTGDADCGDCDVGNILDGLLEDM